MTYHKSTNYTEFLKHAQNIYKNDHIIIKLSQSNYKRLPIFFNHNAINLHIKSEKFSSVNKKHF